MGRAKAVTAVAAAAVATWLIRLLSRLRKPSRPGARASAWPLDAWVSLHSEDALDPEEPIIDPHHHLWDPSSQPVWDGVSLDQARAFYASAEPRALARIAINNEVRNGNVKLLGGHGRRQPPKLQPYMGSELLLDIRNRHSGKRGHNVVKTVCLECGWFDKSVDETMRPLGEVVAFEEVHHRFQSLCNGVVAFADLRRPDINKLLQAYSARALVKGIRHDLQWTDDDQIGFRGTCDKDTTREATFRANFGLLERYGLSFDAAIFHDQLDDIAELARSFPGVTIVINHIGFPLGRGGKYTREGTFATWERSMRDIASDAPNVHVKLSGLGMGNFGFEFHKSTMPPSSQELAAAWRPYFRVVLDAFGARRCMFASNFPVDKMSFDYTVMWNAFKLIIKDCSPEDRQALLHGTAQRIYKL